MPGHDTTSLARTQTEWLADGAACLEAALTYLAAGWCPIPLCPPDHVGVRERGGSVHGHKCRSPGKSPLIARWTSFPALPTADQIRGWWRQWPNCNLGIVLGQISGVIGIDVDGARGETTWTAAVKSGELPPPTAAFTTSAGNRRLLFSITPNQVVNISKTKLGEHQEIRVLGEGSLTVAPPSRHWRGGYYTWTTPFSRPKATIPHKTPCGTSDQE
jgi:hypothetical protein